MTVVDVAPAEQVVLVDAAGSPCGTALKSEVHTDQTPLHLAFSCHVYNRAGQVLVTRRSLAKTTWPGVWTNSFCGHPAPGEAMVDALYRRASHELGIAVHSVEPILPDFRYRARDASGVVENEVCPVFRAVTDEGVTPRPDEVSEWEWVDPQALASAVDATPFAFSPWLVLQLAELAE